MTDPSIHLFERDPVLVAAQWHGIYFTLWSGMPTVGHLQRLARYSATVAQRRPNGYVTLANVPLTASIPQVDLLQEAERQMQVKQRAHRAIAYVIEGSGFSVAAARAVMTGLLRLAPRELPTRVFDRVDTAAAWLVPHLGASARETPPAEVVNRVASLRRPADTA